MTVFLGGNSEGVFAGTHWLMVQQYLFWLVEIVPVFLQMYAGQWSSCIVHWWKLRMFMQANINWWSGCIVSRPNWWQFWPYLCRTHWTMVKLYYISMETGSRHWLVVKLNCSLVAPCLESQDCHLIPLYCLLFFCLLPLLVFFLPTGKFSGFFRENSLVFFVKEIGFLVWLLFSS